jgi:hypothetical protein
VKRLVTMLTASVLLLLTVLVTPAEAAPGAGTVYIYSSVLGKPWYYSQLDHNGWLGVGVARDIRDNSWTSNESVMFTAATQGAVNLYAYVHTAGTNCSSGGPDKWVRLQVYSNNTYRGDVAYVHLRTLNVSAGTWISTNTNLGLIQNAASCCSAGDTCWTGIHTHMEKFNGTWASGGVGASHAYSTPVITFLVSGGPSRPANAPPQDLPLRGPVK